MGESGDEREIGTEEILKEIMLEKFPNILLKKTLINTTKNLNKFQVGKMQISTGRQIIIKRQDILKRTREKCPLTTREPE